MWENEEEVPRKKKDKGMDKKERKRHQKFRKARKDKRKQWEG